MLHNELLRAELIKSICKLTEKIASVMAKQPIKHEAIVEMLTAKINMLEKEYDECSG